MYISFIMHCVLFQAKHKPNSVTFSACSGWACVFLKRKKYAGDGSFGGQKPIQSNEKGRLNLRRPKG